MPKPAPTPGDAAQAAGPESASMVIRVYLENGSIESFVQADETTARATWENLDPVRLFVQPRLVIAGEHSKSVFVGSAIVRVDFVQHFCPCWQFPEDYSDIVELTEAEFRKHAHLEEPELMVKRQRKIPVGDSLVSFIKLQFRNTNSLFLMVEHAVKLPIDNQSFMRFLLSKTGFHMRLRGGGVGVVNLAHLVGYTVYPGVAQVPSDTWPAEPLRSA